MLNKNKTEEILTKILHEDTGCSHSDINWFNEEYILKNPDCEDLWCSFTADNLSDDSLRALLQNFNVFITFPYEQPQDAEEGVTYFQVQISERESQEEKDEIEIHKIRIQKQAEALEKSQSEYNFYLSSEDLNYVQTALFSFNNHFASIGAHKDVEKISEIMTRIGTLSKFLDKQNLQAPKT